MAPRDVGAASIYSLSVPYTVKYGYDGTAPAYGSSAGIIRGDGSDWFGPLNPLPPIAPREVRGRQWDMPAGFNLVQQPRAYEVVGFPLLRALADSYDLLRLVIETRKDQLSRLDWNFRMKRKPNDRAMDVPADVQVNIDKATEFFRRPDQEHSWRLWLRIVLEDLLVIDAPTLFRERARGGKLLALRPLDGATIKPVVDDWGRTPRPYEKDGELIVPPAYQQVLKGFPAVNYSATDLIYRPYNKRAHKVYGYSPVEQILITVNMALRRQIFNLNYFSEGNIPEALIGAPEGWTPQQIAQFQMWWDNMLTGNLAARRRAKFVPGGVAKTFVATKEFDPTNKMDEWLARLVCFAFSINPQPFVSMMNRATAEEAKETAAEEGVEPLKRWVEDFINEEVVCDPNTSFYDPRIEFAFASQDVIDPMDQTDMLVNRVKSGIYTINQALETLGRPLSNDPAADQHMCLTSVGYVPLDANKAAAGGKGLDAVVAENKATEGAGGGVASARSKPASKNHEAVTEMVARITKAVACLDVAPMMKATAAPQDETQAGLMRLLEKLASPKKVTRNAKEQLVGWEYA
jgi:phage portal protein BeeE